MEQQGTQITPESSARTIVQASQETSSKDLKETQSFMVEDEERRGHPYGQVEADDGAVFEVPHHLRKRAAWKTFSSQSSHLTIHWQHTAKSHDLLAQPDVGRIPRKQKTWIRFAAERPASIGGKSGCECFQTHTGKLVWYFGIRTNSLMKGIVTWEEALCGSCPQWTESSSRELSF